MSGCVRLHLLLVRCLACVACDALLRVSRCSGVDDSSELDSAIGPHRGRVGGPAHEGGGDGALNDAHAEGGDTEADDERENAHHDLGRIFLSRHGQHHDERRQRTGEEVATPEHGGGEIVVDDRGEELGLEELAGATSTLGEGGAVDGDLCEGVSV